MASCQALSEEQSPRSEEPGAECAVKSLGSDQRMMTSRPYSTSFLRFVTLKM